MIHYKTLRSRKKPTKIGPGCYRGCITRIEYLLSDDNLTPKFRVVYRIETSPDTYREKSEVFVDSEFATRTMEFYSFAASCGAETLDDLIGLTVEIDLVEDGHFVNVAERRLICDKEV